MVSRGGAQTLDSPGEVSSEQFSELLRASSQAAYRLALAMLREPGLAEDAVQEAALRAWKKRSSLRASASFRAWFLAIVANESRSVRRARWFRARTASVELEGAVPADVDVSDRRLDVARRIRMLGPEDRLAVYLYYYLDLAVEDAAAIMGCSCSAFRSRLARVVHRLRPGLELEDVAGG